MVYEHYKPLLADHAAAEALGRFAKCEAMACTSLVVAKSGTKGKLRQLQTGTTLRRLVGATLVAHDKENLRQTVEQAQFEIAEPAGIELMGHTMQALMEAIDDLAWLQLDCTNQRVWGAAYKHSTTRCRSCWRSRDWTRATHSPQLHLRPHHHWANCKTQSSKRNERAVTGCFSFLDGLTLAVPHEAAENARQLAREKLAAVGLRLNMTKCMIYTPSQVAPPGMEDWWEQTKRHDGFIIDGRPYSIEEESLATNLEGVGTMFPVGENPGRLRRNCENQDSDGVGTWKN